MRDGPRQTAVSLASRPVSRPKPRSGEQLVEIGVARAALAYWTRRLDRLPHRKRAARREARAMIARWERRYREAVVARRAAKPAGRLAVRLGAERFLAPPRAPGGRVERRRRVAADRRLERGRRWRG